MGNDGNDLIGDTPYGAAIVSPARPINGGASPVRAALPDSRSPSSRVLIVKMSSIGDVVQALPVATALRRRDTGVRITWAVEHDLAPLVEGHPAVDRVVRFPAMRWRTDLSVWRRQFTAALGWLRAETYDVAI